MYIRFDITFVGENYPINVAVQVIGCSKSKSIKTYHLYKIDIQGEKDFYKLLEIEFIKDDKPFLNYMYGNERENSVLITDISFSESISDFML